MSGIPRVAADAAEDDLECDYDSTWDDDQHHTPSAESRRTKSRLRMTRCLRNEYAARDMQQYRHGYPRLWDDVYRRSSGEDMTNLRFYLNEIPCQPDGLKIDTILESWKGDYDKLEHVHTYIQWLFPLQEQGLNHLVPPLTKEEITEFCKSQEATGRLVESYKLMLDFYGIELDENTGEVKRAQNWKARFDNLNRNTHNNLRITRILKCLGELGFERYQAPLVHFFLMETLTKNDLGNMKKSVLDYFLFSIKNKEKRRKEIQFALTYYQPQSEFVWCPRRIQLEIIARRQPNTTSTTNYGQDTFSRGNNYDHMSYKAKPMKSPTKIENKHQTKGQSECRVKSQGNPEFPPCTGRNTDTIIDKKAQTAHDRPSGGTPAVQRSTGKSSVSNGRTSLNESMCNSSAKVPLASNSTYRQTGKKEACIPKENTDAGENQNLPVNEDRKGLALTVYNSETFNKEALIDKCTSTETEISTPTDPNVGENSKEAGMAAEEATDATTINENAADCECTSHEKFGKPNRETDTAGNDSREGLDVMLKDPENSSAKDPNIEEINSSSKKALNTGGTLGENSKNQNRGTEKAVENSVIKNEASECIHQIIEIDLNEISPCDESSATASTADATNTSNCQGGS